MSSVVPFSILAVSQEKRLKLHEKSYEINISRRPPFCVYSHYQALRLFERSGKRANWSSFRAPTLWFVDLTIATCHIQSTFLHFFITRKWTKDENTQSPPFSYDTKIKMAADSYFGAQSIDSERASLKRGLVKP